MFEFIVFIIVLIVLWNLRRAGKIYMKDSRKIVEMNAVKWHNSLELIDDATLDNQINEILNPSTKKKG